MPIREYRNWEVILSITREVKYLVEARTSEEAEDVAENLAIEGEQPLSVESTEVLVQAAYPADVLSSDEVVLDPNV